MTWTPTRAQHAQNGNLKPVGAVLPPQAADWIRARLIDVLVATGPAQRQLTLAV